MKRNGQRAPKRFDGAEWIDTAGTEPIAASESLQAALDAARTQAARDTRAQYGPANLPALVKPHGTPKAAAKPIRRQRSNVGQFVPDDDAALLASAQAEADSWLAYVSREGYKGETGNKEAASRKRKGSGGREVTAREKAAYAPATFHADPPVSLCRIEYRGSHGLAIANCLGCGEALRRFPDSDRPCPFCKGRFFAWDSRETDTWIGEDYSLPASWYGDLTGVSAHYIAVERLVNEPRDAGGGQAGRCKQALRIIPTGPVGTLRWLTTRAEKIGPKRGRKSKAVAYFEAVDASNEALFHDGTTGQTLGGAYA